MSGNLPPGWTSSLNLIDDIETITNGRAWLRVSRLASVVMSQEALAALAEALAAANHMSGELAADFTERNGVVSVNLREKNGGGQ